MDNKKISITGYDQDCICAHCGRSLKHGIKISDGRIVGATCLDKKISAPKTYLGKKYRIGSEKIINAAKVVQFVTPAKWLSYGVNQHVLEFDLADLA